MNNPIDLEMLVRLGGIGQLILAATGGYSVNVWQGLHSPS